MLHYETTDLRKGINVAKSKNSKKCITCHHSYDCTYFYTLATGAKIWRCFALMLFRMGLFRAIHGWVCQQIPLPKTCHAHPSIMKLITYLNKNKKTYK